MPRWTLGNAHKKNVEERSIWSKDGDEICRIEWYRWGTWSTESEQRPDVDTDNPDGYDIHGSDVDWEIVDMTDGVAAGWQFPDGMADEERTRIEELYDEDGYSGLEDDGWENIETEIYLHGPLELASNIS